MKRATPQTKQYRKEIMALLESLKECHEEEYQWYIQDAIDLVERHRKDIFKSKRRTKIRDEQMIDNELQRRADIEFEDERDCDCCNDRFDIDDLTTVVSQFGNEKHFCDECNIPF